MMRSIDEIKADLRKNAEERRALSRRHCELSDELREAERENNLRHPMVGKEVSKLVGHFNPVLVRGLVIVANKAFVRKCPNSVVVGQIVVRRFLKNGTLGKKAYQFFKYCGDVDGWEESA